MSLLKNLFGAATPPHLVTQGQSPAMTATQVAMQQQAWAGQLGQAQSQYQNQLNQQMQQMVGAAMPIPTFNEHVPVWDEGGYEPWLGKPTHRTDYCQRCMFL